MKWLTGKKLGFSCSLTAFGAMIVAFFTIFPVMPPELHDWYFDIKNQPANAEELVKHHLQVCIPGSPVLLGSGVLLGPTIVLANKHCLDNILKVSKGNIEILSISSSADLVLIRIQLNDLTQEEKAELAIKPAKKINLGETLYFINPDKKNKWSKAKVCKIYRDYILLDNDYIFSENDESRDGFSGTGVYNRAGEHAGIIHGLYPTKEVSDWRLFWHKLFKKNFLAVIPSWEITKFMTELNKKD